MHRAIFVLVTTLAVAVSCAARAQSDFDITDRNNDGKLNHQEFTDRQVEIFYLDDANRDGRLAIEEIGGVDPERFSAADKDGDGSLSLDEFLAARSVDFDDADRSEDDGALSPAEVQGATY